MALERAARSLLVDGAPLGRVEGQVIAVAACDDAARSLVLTRVEGAPPRLWRFHHDDGRVERLLDAAPEGDHHLLAPRGERVFAYGRHGGVVQWAGVDGAAGAVGPHGYRMAGITCSLDGRHLALAYEGAYDAHKGAWQEPQGRVVAVDGGAVRLAWQGAPTCVFTEDGAAVVTLTPELTALRVAPLDGSTPRQIPLGGVVHPRALVSERGGRRVALLGTSFEVLVCDCDEARVTRKFWVEGTASLLGFAAGKMVFRERREGRARRVVWDVATGVDEELPGEADHLGALTPDAAWVLRHPAPLLLLTSARDGEARRFHDGHEAPVIALAWSWDGARLATAAGGAVRVRDVARDELVWSFEFDAGNVVALTFSPDGRRLYGSGGRSLVTWDLVDGVEAQRAALPSESEPGELLASPDGAHLVLRSPWGGLHVFDAGRGNTPRWHGGYVGAIGFDGPASGWSISNDRSAPGATRVTVRRFAVATGAWNDLTLSFEACDEVTVADGRGTTAVALRNGALVRLDLVHEGSLHPLAPGERWAHIRAARDGVALVERPDGTLATVDVTEGVVDAVVSSPRRIAKVALAPQGHRLAVVYGDGGVEVFDTTP